MKLSFSYRTHRSLALFIFLLLIWFSSGTLTPYAITTAAPLPLPPCGYLYNGDHEHFKASFLMLDGAPFSQYGFSVVLRRLLYPIFTYPFMKLWGYEVGGFIFNIFLHAITFLFFVQFLKKRIGEKGAIWSGWLLATYPGTLYWAGMPYAYAAIIPSTLILTAFIWELCRAQKTADFAKLLFAIGILLTAYDLMPFFGVGAIFVLIARKKYKLLPLSALVVIPQFLVIFWLKYAKGVDWYNSNTSTYSAISSGWLHPVWHDWKPFLLSAPIVLWKNFLDCNYTFIPLFFLVLIGTLKYFRSYQLNLAEKACLVGGLLLFMFNNLVPPYGGWQMRGVWIARLYQPIIGGMILAIARALQDLKYLKKNIQLFILTLGALCIVENFLIGIGPIAGFPGQAGYFHYAFYQHSAEPAPHMLGLSIKKYGRRPVGFCGHQ